MAYRKTNNFCNFQKKKAITAGNKILSEVGTAAELEH